ncbi:endo alpha-1,4 polygalactosaminidase [Gimesia maris]|uniref:endo alpha-1,4 polygalactosaminidase n=1 Tax=Gimesia maris TaxID=122 RepID=UPI0030DAC561|tara:strand:- start:62440 stop:63390 length:951 start_codon:yes stop_codon:yes gene_type:complete
MKLLTLQLLLFVLCLITSTIQPLSATEQKRFIPAGFQLYYGSDPQVLDQLQQRIQPGQVIVIELRGLSPAQIQKLADRAHQEKAKLIAYLSVGELGQIEHQNFQQYLQRHTPQISLADLTLSKNETFQSWQMDVSQSAWRDFLIQRVKQIYQQPVDGLFLDTVDTVDFYITNQAWKIPRRVQSVKAMVALIRKIKAVSPEKFILQNRGLNLIGNSVFVGDATGVFVPGLNLQQAHPHNPDGLLWESAYMHAGDWIESKEREMIQIQKQGFTSVFTLGYTNTNGERNRFFQKSRAAGFIPAWGSSTTRLHRELTESE